MTQIKSSFKSVQEGGQTGKKWKKKNYLHFSARHWSQSPRHWFWITQNIQNGLVLPVRPDPGITHFRHFVTKLCALIGALVNLWRPNQLDLPPANWSQQQWSVRFFEPKILCTILCSKQPEIMLTWECCLQNTNKKNWHLLTFIFETFFINNFKPRQK